MRLLVCGNREYNNYEKVKRIIEQIDPSVIIVGGCRGVGTLALKAAKELGIELDGPYIADWNNSPRGAGVIRDKEMLKQNPDVVVAIFDDSKCKDTISMVSLARDVGMPVLELFVRD